MVIYRHLRLDGLSVLAAIALCSCSPFTLDSKVSGLSTAYFGQGNSKETRKLPTKTGELKETSNIEAVDSSLIFNTYPSSKDGEYTAHHFDLLSVMSSRGPINEYLFARERGIIEGYQNMLQPSRLDELPLDYNPERDATRILNLLGREVWKAVYKHDNPISNTFRTVKEGAEGVIKSPLEKIFNPDRLDVDLGYNKSDGFKASLQFVYSF